MFEIITHKTFDEWLDRLKDRKAAAKINARLRSASAGNLGDVEPVGEGFSEFRIHYGPGYRVYFKQYGRFVLVVLCGGIKKTQRKDIERAKTLFAVWETENGR